jgi:signal transduction histidine kinase
MLFGTIVSFLKKMLSITKNKFLIPCLMKYKIVFLLVVFFQLLIINSFGQKTTVIVVDPSGNAIPKLGISIDGSKFIKTNNKGNFQYTPTKALELPFKILTDTKEYKIEEYFYYNDENEIEIVVSKVEKEQGIPITIFVIDSIKTPVSSVKLYIKNTLYISDEEGKINYQGPVPQESDIRTEGYEATGFHFNKRKKTILLEVKPLAGLAGNEVFQNILPEDSIQKIGIPAFAQFKQDFDSLEAQIINERMLLEKKNEEIAHEISSITQRLKEEKNLTNQERKVLEKYLDHLEDLLLENGRTYSKFEKQKKGLMLKLRMMVMANDSIAYISKLQIEKAEREKRLAEEETIRNTIIFGSIAAVLLILVLIFYFISKKIRKQKRELEEVNFDLEEVRQELEHQNVQLDAFVYKASHDIKGPLKSVIGLTQTGMKIVKDPTSMEFFEHIHKSVMKLDQLVSDLLKLTKAKQAEVNKTEVNILNVTQECLSSFQNLKEYKDMTFTVDIDPKLQYNTDEKIFYSIVQNFIENGIKYKDDKKPKPYLKIKAAMVNGKLVMKFEDNGLGIAEEHHLKIFDMFYKIDPSSNGTGLGLHIVKLNIEKLNGKVGVESAVGKGTTFTVVFKK